MIIFGDVHPGELERICQTPERFDLAEFERRITKFRVDVARTRTVKPTTAVTRKPARPVAIIDPDNAPVDELLNLVASYLSGRPVTVKFGYPKSLNASGETQYRLDGSCRIVIDENLTGLDSRFTVFLHEVAHCLHDDARPQESAGVKAGREARADNQVRSWQAFAAQNWWKVGFDGEPVHIRELRALLTWTNILF